MKRVEIKSKTNSVRSIWRLLTTEDIFYFNEYLLIFLVRKYLIPPMKDCSLYYFSQCMLQGGSKQVSFFIMSIKVFTSERC